MTGLNGAKSTSRPSRSTDVVTEQGKTQADSEADSKVQQTDKPDNFVLGKYWENNTLVDSSANHVFIKRARMQYEEERTKEEKAKTYESSPLAPQDDEEKAELPAETVYQGVNHFALSSHPKSVLSRMHAALLLPKNPKADSHETRLVLTKAATIICLLVLTSVIVSGLLCALLLNHYNPERIPPLRIKS